MAETAKKLDRYESRVSSLTATSAIAQCCDKTDGGADEPENGSRILRRRVAARRNRASLGMRGERGKGEQGEGRQGEL
jgi:hypothetical protein